MERYQNVSRARFLCSKWVMRTRRRRTYPDAVESAVHSRRKEFGGGKEGRGRKRRITGWHGDGGGESPGRLPLDHRGKLATSAESRPRRRRCSGVDAPQPLLLPPFLPSFLSLRLVSWRNNPTLSPVSARDQPGPEREGLEGVGRVCAAATVDRIVCAHAQPKVRQLRH